MFKNESKTEKLFWFTEKYLPILISSLVVIISIFVSIYNDFLFISTFEKILDATIMFSSIIIGFVGVLLAILFSIRNSDIIELLFKTRAKLDLKKYFKRTILAGILLVLICAILYINNTINTLINLKLFNVFLPSEIMFTLWLFLSTYLIASTYRIISIMMHIIFKDDTSANQEPEAYKLDDQKKNELKRQYSKK